jgi:hypothetical protein
MFPRPACIFLLLERTLLLAAFACAPLFVLSGQSTSSPSGEPRQAPFDATVKVNSAGESENGSQHLPAKTFEFTRGTANSDGYVRATLSVRPFCNIDKEAVACSFFPGSSRMALIYTLKVVESIPPGQKLDEVYPEQTVKAMRAVFDTGTVNARYRDDLGGDTYLADAPANSKKALKIEVDFDLFHKTYTLSWTPGMSAEKPLCRLSAVLEDTVLAAPEKEEDYWPASEVDRPSVYYLIGTRQGANIRVDYYNQHSQRVGSPGESSKDSCIKPVGPIEYKSGSPGILRVDDEFLGHVMGVSPGWGSVQVTQGKWSQTLYVRVQPTPTCTTALLSTSSDSILVGETAKALISFEPNGCDLGPRPSNNLHLEPPTGAGSVKIRDEGTRTLLITGVKEGNVTIRMNYLETPVEANLTVRPEPPCEGVVAEYSKTEINIGATTGRPAITYFPEHCVVPLNEFTGKVSGPTFTVSPDAVARIDKSNGQVTGVSPGDFTVTASQGTLRPDTLRLRVNTDCTNLQVLYIPGDIVLPKQGAVPITMYTPDGCKPPSDNATYSIAPEDSAIATIDKNTGAALGDAPGTAHVFVSQEPFHVTAALKILQPPCGVPATGNTSGANANGTSANSPNAKSNGNNGAADSNPNSNGAKGGLRRDQVCSNAVRAARAAEKQAIAAAKATYDDAEYQASVAAGTATLPAKLALNEVFNAYANGKASRHELRVARAAEAKALAAAKAAVDDAHYQAWDAYETAKEQADLAFEDAVKAANDNYNAAGPADDTGVVP